MTWRDWLTIHYLHHIAEFLPTPFADADFAFFGKTLAGQQQQLDRNKRAVALLKQSGIKGNMAVPYEWGEYVLWHMSPGVKVSMQLTFHAS